jgi:hypothetical protein
MSCDRYACHLHHRSIETYKNIGTVEQRRKRVEKKIQKSRVFRDLDEAHEKKITSYRLGVSYKKEFSWYRDRFYKCNYNSRRLKVVTDKQTKRYNRHKKKYKSWEDYRLTFQHKCLLPPNKRKVKPKLLNNFQKWRAAAAELYRAVVSAEKGYYEEVICPECPLVRCIRIQKNVFFWPDYKNYDRTYYPPCKCGYIKKKLDLTNVVFNC